MKSTRADPEFCTTGLRLTLSLIVGPHDPKPNSMIVTVVLQMKLELKLQKFKYEIFIIK